MARGACLGCRTRKVKCLPSEGDSQCKHCIKRKIPCSLSRQSIPNEPQTTRDSIPAGSSLRPLRAGAHGKFQSLALLNSSSGLDVGTGSPAEILREGELTQSLLLLYFNHFDDIHVMLDQTSFMRQFALGNVPQALLYAIMALGIRYTQAPLENPHLRAHWGEPLFNQARDLLKNEFDHPSVITAQIYILLATYHFTFGGTRKAWLSLGFARTIVNLLQLDRNPPETDPFQDEMSRRLVATIGLMENLFTPSVTIRRGLLPISPLPTLYSEEDFNMIKKGTFAISSFERKPCLMNEILGLSEIFFQVRQQWPLIPASVDMLNNFRGKLDYWRMSLPNVFWYSEANMKLHLHHFQLRPFAFLHLIHNHIWQLLLFECLEWPPRTYNSRSDDSTNDPAGDLSKIYDHTVQVTDILSGLWHLASCDIHNACFAQIATTTVVVLVHRVLSTRDSEEMTAAQSHIQTVRDCLSRVKQHCCLFNWVVAQVESFLHTCTQPEFWLDKTAWNTVLYDQLMSLGTSFERLNYETAGRQGFGIFVYSQPLQGEVPKILNRDFCYND